MYKVGQLISNPNLLHAFEDIKYSRLSLSRLRLSRITAYLEWKIWPLFKHSNLTSGNKLLWKRGEIAHQEQFLSFATVFSIFLFLIKESNYIFICEIWMCDMCFFLNSENLICRGTDISKCFRGSFQLWDNESRLDFDCACYTMTKSIIKTKH